MVSDNLLNHFLSSAEIVFRTFDEHATHLGVRHRLESDLDLCTRLSLQLTNSLAILTNNKTDNVIRHVDNTSLGRGRPIRRHHGIVNFLTVCAHLLAV